jgi:hypothetical protein
MDFVKQCTSDQTRFDLQNQSLTTVDRFMKRRLSDWENDRKWNSMRSHATNCAMCRCSQTELKTIPCFSTENSVVPDDDLGVESCVSYPGFSLLIHKVQHSDQSSHCLALKKALTRSPHEYNIDLNIIYVQIKYNDAISDDDLSPVVSKLVAMHDADQLDRTISRSPTRVGQVTST